MCALDLYNHLMCSFVKTNLRTIDQWILANFHICIETIQEVGIVLAGCVLLYKTTYKIDVFGNPRACDESHVFL